nr:MAG TPA: hypothetical protein [Caudoviricetes sp.]
MGISYNCKNIYRAIPVVPTVLIYCLNIYNS